MTAYRQCALACVAALAQGPRSPRDLKASIPDAPRILYGNVYGWFARVERGVYDLTEAGRGALLRWPQPDITGFPNARRSVIPLQIWHQRLGSNALSMDDGNSAIGRRS